MRDGSRTSSAPDAYIAACPGCGAHLEDTWTGDDCGRCGFSYIAEAEDSRRTPRRPAASTGTRRSIAGHAIAVVGMMVILVSSISQPPADAVVTSQGQSIMFHAEGLRAMLPATAGTAFGAMLCLLAGSLWGGPRA